MNYRMIRNTLGWILLFEGCFMLVPLFTAAVYREWKELLVFLLTIAICAAAGALLVLFKPKSKALYAKEGFVIVSLSWILLSLFGALPFYLSGHIPSYIDALFETVSGFSTTGASILTDVEVLPKCLLMWRSFTHWVGGMGVLVFIMAFLPLSGGSNMHIMKAESTGPSVGKLVPRVRHTAMLLYFIYLALTLLEFILLLCGNMSVFEALNVAFSTAGTGGFGFRNDSLASFSPYIQIVVGVFMLLFSVNFTTYYLLWRRKFKESFTTELRVFLFIVFSAIVLIMLDVMRANAFATTGEGLRNVFFSVASIISTTGFVTADFNLWPAFSKTVIVLLMFVGACAGSTGGGIKVSRLFIFFKSLGTEMSRMLHPKQTKKPTLDGRPVEATVQRTVFVYMAAYILIFIVSVLLLSIDERSVAGDELVTNFTAVVASLNNIGPGLDAVGPVGNYAGFSILSKFVLIFDMLAGRLEIFPMLLLFSPKTWKK